MIDTPSSASPALPKEDQVLIVRVWQEPIGATPTDADWRGHVYLSGSARGRRFVGLERLFQVIRSLLGRPAMPEPHREATSTDGEHS